MMQKDFSRKNANTLSGGVASRVFFNRAFVALTILRLISP